MCLTTYACVVDFRFTTFRQAKQKFCKMLLVVWHFTKARKVVNVNHVVILACSVPSATEKDSKKKNSLQLK